MTLDLAVALGCAVVVLLYLVYTLLRPERF
jgi:F subunit of K+-transporting ATPase (Potass_KdpF)